MNLPTPQYTLPDYVCPFAVRVPHGLSLADFLGSWITPLSPSHGWDGVLSGSALRVYLTAPINAYTLQRALPSARVGFTSPSPRRPVRQ